MSAVTKTLIYDATPDALWAALTDPALIAEWLMPNDFEPREGHKFTLRAGRMPGWDGIIHCELLELDPPRKMRWSWQGSNMASATEVIFLIEPVAEGSRLTLVHDGFTGLGGMLLRLMHSAGWGGKFLDRGLRKVVERQRNERSEGGGR